MEISITKIRQSRDNGNAIPGKTVFTLTRGPAIMVITNKAETKWPPFLRLNIQIIVTISSDDSLAPNRQQATIWTNDGMAYWRI